jgi:hypothetical protein
MRLRIIIPVFLLLCATGGSAPAFAGTGERISYRIYPFGRAEYLDTGMVLIDGETLRSFQIRIRILMLEDIEKIYFEPDTFLIRKIERNLTRLLGKERVIEEYDQRRLTVKVRLFRKGRLIKEDLIHKEAPVFNAILLPLYLSTRTQPDLTIPWEFTARQPGTYTLRMEGEETVRLPRGRFPALHFRSHPEKFEIWLHKDHPRIPLKIKGSTNHHYTFIWSGHSQGKNPASKKEP